MVQVELNPGDTLCKQGDMSTEIYILQDGKVDVSVRDKRGRDKIISEISGKNSIFGEIGALLKKPRGASIRASTHAVVQKVDTKNKALEDTILSQPKLGLSLAFNLARYLKETNTRLSQYTQFLTEIRNTVNADLTYYHQKTKSLGDLHDKTHYPWAKTIYDKAKSHGCYTMGETVVKGQEAIGEETPLQAPIAVAAPDMPADALNRQFQPGEVLGREGAEGKEFFILQSGVLEIQVGGRKVSDVKEKGSVIGEVAVLVGLASKKFETRSATIIARELSTVIVIDAPKLDGFVQSNPHLILFIGKVLAARLPWTNQVFIADDEKINKYLALLDASSPTSNTLIHAYELLRTNLHSGAKDKPETEGYAEEVQAKLAEMKIKGTELQDRYEDLVKRWKPI